MLLLLVEFWFDENAEKQGAAGSVNWGPVGHCFSFICVLPARKKIKAGSPEIQRRKANGLLVMHLVLAEDSSCAGDRDPSLGQGLDHT